MVRSKATVQRNLRIAKPFWESTPSISVQTFLQPKRQNYDVIIVGAGISGAILAEALADGKRTIAIVDRRAPVSGSSMASTAMIQHEIDVPLFILSRRLGKSIAERIWLRSRRSVNDLTRLVSKLDIDCQMGEKRALYLAGNEYGLRALKAETIARNEAGLKARYLGSYQLKKEFNIDRTAAIESNVSASANPAQLTAGFLRTAIARGAETIAGVEITDLVSLPNKVVLATQKGSLLTATYVVFCTGYEFLRLLRRKNHKIISTWALASKKKTTAPHWLRNYLVWEASDPYLYFRTANHGRIIAGGEDEPSPTAYLDKAKLDSKSETIARKVSDLIGSEPVSVDYQWAAAFGTTSLGTPMIGEVPDCPNVFAAMGYGGNGITFSKIAADIISAQLMGRDDPDTQLFAFR